MQRRIKSEKKGRKGRKRQKVGRWTLFQLWFYWYLGNEGALMNKRDRQKRHDEESESGKEQKKERQSSRDLICRFFCLSIGLNKKTTSIDVFPTRKGSRKGELVIVFTASFCCLFGRKESQWTISRECLLLNSVRNFLFCNTNWIGQCELDHWAKDRGLVNWRWLIEEIGEGGRSTENERKVEKGRKGERKDLLCWLPCSICSRLSKLVGSTRAQEDLTANDRIAWMGWSGLARYSVASLPPAF